MKQVNNRFTELELDQNEIYMGAILSDLQIIYIRNQLAAVATEMLNLTSAAKDTDETYFRMLEHYRGKMLAFEGLIQYSEALREQMNSSVKEEMDKQPMFGDKG